VIYFVIGAISVILLYNVFIRLFRVQKSRVNKDKTEFQDGVTKLITDFNRISNANINVLEDKISDLRHVVELADQRIIKMNSLLNDLGIMANRFERILDNKEITFYREHEAFLEHTPNSYGSSARYQKVYELASLGSSIEDIARSVDMSKGEVKLVLGLKGKGK